MKLTVEELHQLTIEELNQLIDNAKREIASRVEQSYYELNISASQWKGTGKCWVQRIEDGKRTDFVEPYNVMRSDRYSTEKTYRLQAGTYLVNTKNSKSQDRRYTLTVKEDFTIKES